MRAFVYVALVCAAVTPARADSFVEVAGGLTTPLGDNDWEQNVESSPKVALRVGAFPNEIGGYISADWTPYDTDADGSFGVDVSAHRFRLMGGVIFHHMVSNTLVVTGRGAIGADIAHTSGDVFGVEFSDTDTGLGLELGVGLWFKAGKVEIGGELAIPISTHDEPGGMGEVPYEYTSYDLDLLFGVRFVSY
ncbi:MAG TPA: hypothetical protein VIV11_13825 [Kofleriaceae bacterium]